MEMFGIPPRLLAPLVAPGTVLGPLRPALARRTGLNAVPVIAVAGHDTASAVAGLPLREDEVFVIAGSWTLVGFETDRPHLDAATRAAAFGNEGGVEGRVNVIRSLEGLHLMRRLRDDLAARTGRAPQFSELAQAAEHALQAAVPPLDPADPGLLAAGGLIDAATAQHRRRGVAAPVGAGPLALSLYLGLAGQTARAIAQIATIRGRPARAVRIGGGGAQDSLFCRLLASTLGIPVLAGPVEASATGNALLQLVGLGHASSLAQARALVAHSLHTREYLPEPGLCTRTGARHAGDRT